MANEMSNTELSPDEVAVIRLALADRLTVVRQSLHHADPVVRHIAAKQVSGLLDLDARFHQFEMTSRGLTA